ncbi:MAG: HNH endonuclease signature motif containing protein, partial [Nitriliruptorales bacterium]|nr:HNH endonuclease signature motif containing protein [Nitriliruptorales bacterium]
VVFDGKRPLAVSASQSAAIPDDVRLAVRLRDRGDRFPGSTLPTSDSHFHHLVPRGHDGTHHPDNLLTLGARHHLHHIHQRGWRASLDPHTGQAFFERDGRTFRTLPRGTPLEPPPESGGTDPPP